MVSRRNGRCQGFIRSPCGAGWFRIALISNHFSIMALIKLTAMVDTISGKLNGTVFSNNKGGQYVRSKSLVSNPNSTLQSSVRSVFGSISSAWQGLTESQRQGWISGAQNFPYINRLGDSKMLTGKALFQKLNLNLSVLGLDMLSDIPAQKGAVGLTYLEPTAQSIGDATLEFEGELAGQPNKTALILEATPGLSPGVSNASNRFRTLATSVDIEPISNEQISEETFFTDGAAAWSALSDKFGAPQAGQKVFIRVRPVNTESGESTASRTTTFVFTA